MGEEGWQRIAADVQRHYGAYDGFLVLTGTDTMAYIASALSFMLENLAKPVVLTGSQIPFCEVSQPHRHRRGATVAACRERPARGGRSMRWRRRASL